MNINIGAIIKELRTAGHVTQEALATAIGVTPQAISRWEADGGYPDIESLPLIADFFSVSTDELLGYKLSERQQQLTNIKDELSRLVEVGTADERINFARGVLSKYPSDCEIKLSLAMALYNKYDDTKDPLLLSEAESHALYVADYGKDEDVRYDAILLLTQIYSATKQPDKAYNMASRLSPIKYCRESVLSCGIGDGKNELYRQDEIDKLTDCLGLAIRSLPLDKELPNDPSTWDEKIRMMELSNELYFMIYSENLMFYHCRIAFNYWIISTYQMSQGKSEAALDSLEKMCKHAIAYDQSYQNDHGKYYTSILVDRIVYPEPSKDFHELKEHSQSRHMLDNMQHKRYDDIRNDERFVRISEALSEYAW